MIPYQVKKYIDDHKLYICVNDQQGTGFHVGDTMTANGWAEWAMSMNDFCELSEDTQDMFKKLSPQEQVEWVADFWGIDIVGYDEHNDEHNELKEYWERGDYYA